MPVLCCRRHTVPLTLRHPAPPCVRCDQGANTIDCAESLLFLATYAKDAGQLEQAQRYATRVLALPFAVRAHRWWQHCAGRPGTLNLFV